MWFRVVAGWISHLHFCQNIALGEAQAPSTPDESSLMASIDAPYSSANGTANGESTRLNIGFIQVP